MAKNTDNIQSSHEIELPQTVIESFARFLIPEMRKYYESEQGKREFAEWEEKRKEAAEQAGE